MLRSGFCQKIFLVPLNLLLSFLHRALKRQFQEYFRKPFKIHDMISLYFFHESLTMIFRIRYSEYRIGVAYDMFH